MNFITSPRRRYSKRSLKSFEKGRLFEEYVKSLFNPAGFNLKRWRKSEPQAVDTFNGELSYPDLELIFVGRKDRPFAVECKWRREFNKGRIKWAKDFQIAKYEEFQNKTAMPVFIAIGVGGTPKSPERLFVTSLVELSRCTYVCEAQLKRYNRNPRRKFYYDPRQMKLF